MRHNLAHMQTLQEVLRRTSLAEMRDREVVEWLLGTERWLREFHQPLMPCAANTALAGGDDAAAAGAMAASTLAPSDSLTRGYSSALSELRLLVIGVLHTMPWWRVVETVVKSSAEARASANSGAGGGYSSGGGGGVHAAAPRGGSSRRGLNDGSGSGAAASADRAWAARHAITRWHVRLQIAFERVCLVLIETSPRTVRGVLEVLLKPCQLRPPVRDGARRSIPSDSFIRVLNAVATLYGAKHVIELLESCMADFMPRRRWAERRHHVACTAVLLYVALEGHTPAYHPRLGNSQGLQRAIELLKSLRARYTEKGKEVLSWRLPHATRSSSLTLGTVTSEDSGTDVGGGGHSSSAAASGHSLHRHDEFHRPHRGPMLPSGGGVLPAGYVSATLFEDARSGGYGLRQPALPRPGGVRDSANNNGSSISSNLHNAAVTTTTTASDTEWSEGAASRNCSGDGAPGELRLRSAVPAVSGGTVAGSSDSSSTANTRHARARLSSSASGVKGGGSGGNVSDRATYLVPGDSDAAAAAVASGGVGGGAAMGVAKSAALASLVDVSVEHNNKLLAYRNNIIRLLLNRLLDMEQTLEPREEEEQVCRGGGGVDGALSASMSWMAHGSVYSAGGSRLGSPLGSAPPSGQASPSSMFPVSSATVAVNNNNNNNGSVLFPCVPIAATSPTRDATATAASSAHSSPAALSPAGVSSAPSFRFALSHPHAPPPPPHAHLYMPFGAGAPQPLENFFNSLSLPYLRILRDCTTLVYGRLADDLRRQQVAGSCGNADWWEEILYFYLTVVIRVERPVYLVYLAPSLAMLGTEDESVNLLHKLITLVTKGSMPVEQPRTAVSAATGASGGALGRMAAAPTVQPVRLRMAPPTGGSRRVVTMEERLRAARHIFPLFQFLHSRLDATSAEGVRRRLLKWTAQELRRLGGADFAMSAASHTTSRSFSGGGAGLVVRSRQTPSRESRLALVAFAQCAAISELMEVELLPAAPSVHVKGEAAAASKEGSRFTATPVSGDASDSIAAVLQPLLARYTLQTEQPEEPNDEEEETLEREGASRPINNEDDSHHHSNNTGSDDEDSANDSGDAPASSSESSVSSTTSSAPTQQQNTKMTRQHRSHQLKAEPLPLPLPTIAAAAASDAAAPRRRLDLRQMEFEGLLHPLLMANCPWQAWLQ